MEGGFTSATTQFVTLAGFTGTKAVLTMSTSAILAICATDTGYWLPRNYGL